MAGRKENLKALFTNTRSRIIIIFTIVLLFIAIIIGVIRFNASSSRVSSGANLAVAPSIQSVPGAIDPTAQYASLQQQQNVQQAQDASKKGTSAIPTIIRTQAFGNGVEAVGPQQGQGGVGFATLAMEDDAGNQKSLWLQNLKESNCSKTAVQQVMSQGATLTDLKNACSCAQLRDNGYQFSDLQGVCACKELKAAGFNARQMKDAGMSAGQLRACGFDACELRNAGFTAQEMKDGGFSDGELKGAGFTDQDIARAGGIPDGMSVADIQRAGCDASALSKLRAEGVSASAIRRTNGCSAAQLKAAGYTAQDLKNAGYTAADLKNAGFTPAELKNAGYTARDLLNAGFSPADLSSAGFTPSEIKAAEAELPPGMTPQSIKEAGCSIEAIKRERLAGVSASLIRQYSGCSAAALKAGGFSNDDLANAGFTPAQINALPSAVDDNTIRAAGCDPNKLTALFNQGVSAKKIKELNGCSAAALKAAGYDAKSLLNAGFTPEQLSAAGFTPEQIKAAQAQIAGEAVSDDTIRAAGCDPTKLGALLNQGVSAKRIKDLNGCSAQALKAAGYDAKSLADAGFTPQELLAAGFTPNQLNQAGLNPAGVIAAGRVTDCSVESLRAAKAMGVAASTIKQTLGCSAEAMKAAGYSAAELRQAGFTAAELKNAGFSANDLKAAGFTARDLRAAGFSAQDLKNAGFNPTQLKDAGFSAQDLKNAGFTAAQLKTAGYTAKDLKDAGFSAADLKNAGFTAKDLKDAGYSAGDLKAAGYSAKDLKDAGYTAADLKNGGYSDQELQDAGFTLPDSSVAGLQDPSFSAGPASTVTALPSLEGGPGKGETSAAERANARQLQEILQKQQTQMADQKYQQQIQEKTGAMQSVAGQYVSRWQTVSTQTYIGGSDDDKGGITKTTVTANSTDTTIVQAPGGVGPAAAQNKALIKTGDIYFAVLDTSVNSDEPSPILATIVSGPFKGAKLIGSFNLPSNSDKLVINFNAMSVPGAAKTTSVNAYAIDPNTARTALSSSTNHHYLLRYGSLFAATFLEGFGNAFQSANTTITIGGTGGVQTTTIQNGVGRSILENAVIGLATLGKSWGQVAQVQFNRPTTVEVCSGTGIGVLFTQDITSL